MKSLSSLIYFSLCIFAYSTIFGQEDSATVVDKLSILNHNGQVWFAEGIKLNDEPNFGGYERIDLVTYSSDDSAGNSRSTRYQVTGLIGLKLIRAEALVNLGFPGYGILLEYSWTNSGATPRDYFKTIVVLQLKRDTVIRVWKYNTEEAESPKRKMVFEHIDFMQTSAKTSCDIVVSRIEGNGRDLRKCKNTREIYSYNKDGTFHLMRTELVHFTKNFHKSK